ncbi:protein of unknown function [Alteromonas macleodii]|uniref:Uncharacterized protein n=1 Tax=Alteromonas macleodii TaxID=28108 RepID=A0A6T9Y238_ALTMA|nr:protein of unknown function [Alteromonas macleodii]
MRSLSRNGSLRGHFAEGVFSSLIPHPHSWSWAHRKIGPLHWVRDNRFKTNLLLYWFSGTVACSPTYCHDSKT